MEYWFPTFRNSFLRKPVRRRGMDRPNRWRYHTSFDSRHRSDSDHQMISTWYYEFEKNYRGSFLWAKSQPRYGTSNAAERNKWSNADVYRRIEEMGHSNIIRVWSGNSVSASAWAIIPPTNRERKTKIGNILSLIRSWWCMTVEVIVKVFLNVKSHYLRF